MIRSRSILPTMRNFSGRSCRENKNTHFMSNNSFSENRAVYEIMRENMAQPDRPHMTIQQRHMCIACWTTKTTGTQNLIIFAFQWQQFLRKGASMLCLYVHCLSLIPLIHSPTHTILHFIHDERVVDFHSCIEPNPRSPFLSILLLLCHITFHFYIEHQVELELFI
jgi:hypothetical protein